MSGARELISTNVYRHMVKNWVLAQVALIIGELGGLVSALSGIFPKEILLPTIDLPPLALSDIFINLFSTTISVNGIILGFGSVFVIYYRRWLDSKCMHA